MLIRCYYIGNIFLEQHILQLMRPGLGFKNSKEWITVLACANSASIHKCKLLINGRNKNPQLCRKVLFLPVHYQNNGWSCMTSDIFKKRFKTCFIPEACNHCRKNGLLDNYKIILLLDNCSAHTTLEVHVTDNVFVHYLPANCASIFQPMDQRILQSLKCTYKKEFLLKMLDLCNNEDSISAFQKKFTMKDTLWRIHSLGRTFLKKIFK